MLSEVVQKKKEVSDITPDPREHAMWVTVSREAEANPGLGQATRFAVQSLNHRSPGL